jgi:BirA family biotin operon repressor/biotin-[acetyl-CoA-carboxylase] ligase
VTEHLHVTGGLWREIRRVEQTGSTNADLLAAARAGEAEGLVLVAGEQTAGRGRLGRHWQSPPGTGLTFSVLLRPDAPAAALGWLPLLTGVAVASAVTAVSGVETRLKWPNDVLVGAAKLAGILAEGWDGAVVVGMGINVSHRREDLPGPAATSLLLETAARAATQDRRAPTPDGLLGAVLAELARWYLAWRDQRVPCDAEACGLRAEYLGRCATVGQQVRVMLPGGQSLAGRARGVDAAGRLEVTTADGPVQVSAGDVVHVRPAGAAVAPDAGQPRE